MKKSGENTSVSMVRTRERILAVIAILFVVVMAVYIASASGIRIPFLTDILGALLGW